MARERVWRPLHRPEMGLVDAISDVVCEQEWRNPDLLTSVRLGPTIIIASDYGGDHKASRYESLSFLVADLAFCWLWDQLRRRIRHELLGDCRSMSFKKLGSDKRRAKALVPFLRAANAIPGLLITILIERHVAATLSEPKPRDRSLSQVGALSDWKAPVFGKLTRVGHLGAMLVACLSAPGQNVLWFTDKDKIAPNSERLSEATRIIGHYLNHYVPHKMGHFRLGTTQSDDGSMEIEDLAALPDLTAGAVAEVLTHVLECQGGPLGTVFVSVPERTSRKARAILGWLAEGPHPLRKALVCVDWGRAATYTVKLVSILSESPIAEYDWRLEARDYMQDKILLYLP